MLGSRLPLRTGFAGLIDDLVRELKAGAATGAARGHRGLMLTAASELSKCADLRALLEGVVGGDDVLQRVIAMRQEVESPVFVVYGRELSDSEGSSWVAHVSRSKGECEGLAVDLNGLAGRFGASLGKADLVGLEPIERSELESYVLTKDKRVRVGRHGVRWSVDSVQAGRR